MNKWLYFAGMGQALLFFFTIGFLPVLGEMIGRDTAMQVFLIFLSVSCLISISTFLVFIHNIWDAIQSQYSKVTPLRAALCLLIPIYNFYWFHVVTVDWAKAYNRLIRTAEPPVAKTSEELPVFLFYAYIVNLIPCLTPLSFPPFLVLIIIFISNACDAVNRLSKVSVIAYASINAHAVTLEEDGWSEEILSKTRKRGQANNPPSETKADEWSPDKLMSSQLTGDAETKSPAKPYQPITDGIKDPWA